MEKELGIYPQEGVNIFEILLSEPKPQMVVSVQDLNMFLDLADTQAECGRLRGRSDNDF